VGIVGGLVLALAAAAAVVVVAGRAGDRPAGVVAEATTGFAGWRGVELAGTVVDDRGDDTAVSLTVAADGVARGTLTRDFGASAEFVSDGVRTLLRGNAEWWLWSYPGVAADLADRWVENPPADATGLVPVELLTPRVLAGILQEPGGTWARTGERTVAGQRGADFYDGDRLAVIAADGPPRLLALDVGFPPPPQVVPRAFGTQDGPPAGADLGRLVPSAHFQVGEPSDEALGLLRDAIGLIAEEIGGPDEQAARDLVGESGEYGPHVLTVLDRLANPPAGGPTDRLTPEDALKVVQAAVAKHEFATLHQLVVSNTLDSLAPLVKFMDTLGKQRDFEPGYKRHLQEAARQSMPREAHGQAPRIVLDANYDGAQGDLMLLFDRAVAPSETWQLKTITSPSEQSVIGHIEDAARQVNGEPGKRGGPPEVPFPDSERVVHLLFERGAYARLGLLGREGVREALIDVGIYDILTRNGRRVDRVVVTNHAVPPEEEGRAQREYVFGREEFKPDDGTAPGAESGPGPQPGPAPAPAPGPAPAPTDGLFTEAGQDGAEGPLVEAAAPAARPVAGTARRLGGIDFSSLELRYLGEPAAGEGLRYAFTAAPGGSGSGAGLEVARRASDAFFVWLALPPETFTVNLNPDEPDRIVDERLGRTVPGRVLLEADLELKRNASRLIHPDTELGRRYWDALRALGSPCTSYRQWIVPGPATVYEADGGLYILDAPLEVKMESEYFQTVGAGAAQACANPPEVERRTEQLYRSMVLPEIVEAVNTAPEYAALRQVYLSRVAAEWYRQRSAAEPVTYSELVDSGDIAPWAVEDGWSPRVVFDAAVKSFTEGEFNVTREERNGDTIEVRNYVSGGVDFSTVPVHAVSGDEFRAAGLHGVVDGAFDRPTEDGAGRIWLGSSSPPPGGWPVMPDWMGKTVGYGSIVLMACWWVLSNRISRRRRERRSAVVR
jgi:hypothetical protein